MSASSKQGFTLLELAIVLTIIGLIAAGITAGSSLINAAERRAVITDVAQYTAAVEAFETKYEALPGDMYNATYVWGEAHTTPATCETTITNDARTCNGNGDNKIGDTGEEYEMFRAWQQLASAGFVEGRFTGRSTSSSDPDRAIAKTDAANVPLSSMNNAGFTLRWVGSTTADPYFDNSDYGHVIVFGTPTTNTITSGAILTPEEAWSMDSKNDDGLPGTGKIRSYNNSAQADCANSDVTTTAEYETTITSTECNLVFVTGF